MTWSRAININTYTNNNMISSRRRMTLGLPWTTARLTLMCLLTGFLCERHIGLLCSLL